MPQILSKYSVVPILKRFLRAYALFAFLNVAYKIYLSLKSVIRAKSLWKHVPGDEIDLTGTVALANAKRIHDFLTEKMNEHPEAPIIKLPMPVPWLYCNTAESVQWMLKDEFDHITKPGGDDALFEMMQQFLGKDGIFTLRHGETDKLAHDMWFKERKVSSKIFTKANFESMFYDTFVDKGHRFLNRLAKEEGKYVDIQEMFFSYTMDSIEKFFMGTEVNTVEGGMSEYAKAFDAAHRSMVHFIMTHVPVEVLNRLVLPFPFGNLIPAQATNYTILTKIVGLYNQDIHDFKRAVKKLDNHIAGYVKQTRADPNMAQRKDIIANFLNSKIGAELTDRQLRDIVLNLTIAGRDTTACAMSWMIYELTQNPEVQKKLVEEIAEKLNGRIPTLADLEAKNMPYLNGVLYETLRLHPSVPTNQKVVERDLQYYDGTVIPRGTMLFYCPYAMGRNPKVYPEPMKFKPERWEDQPTLYEYPVFQAGPRFCLGKDMAQFEAKLLIAMVLQKYTFTLKPGENENISYSLMLTASVANNADKTSQQLWVKPTAIN